MARDARILMSHRASIDCAFSMPAMHVRCGLHCAAPRRHGFHLSSSVTMAVFCPRRSVPNRLLLRRRSASIFWWICAMRRSARRWCSNRLHSIRCIPRRRARRQPNTPHTINLHGFHFEILERETSPYFVHALAIDEHGRLAADLGRKDTVLVWPGESVRVALRFAMPFQGPQTYLFHCHNLEHEDGGMMLGVKVA